MDGKRPRLTLQTTLLLLSLALYGTVPAQTSDCGTERSVPARALDQLTWKQLNRVYEDVGDEKYDNAHDDLQKMLKRAGNDKYLLAVLNQALAQVEWSRSNFDESLEYFESAVELDALPNPSHFALMYQVAQLYFMKDRYQDALDALDLWFCAAPKDQLTAQAWVLKAAISAQKEDYRAALVAIDQALAMDDEPEQNWYQLELAAHFELEQFPQAAETLELMISHWPDRKSYWTRLSQVYYKLGRERESLATMALAYRKNLLDTQDDILYLSSLYSNANVPYKAAEVLERGIHDGLVEPSKSLWTAVAESWYAAEEPDRSLLAFEEAGKAAADGDIDLRRGFILVDLENWQEALDALNAALDKGGLNDRRAGEAYLLRGMAQFNLDNLEAASADWGRASRYESTRDAARQWMNHLQEERLRRAS